MTDKNYISFIYIIDASAVLQNIIRSFEISKRLAKENIFPIILTYKIRKNAPFKYTFITKIPPSFKIYKTLFFKLKNKYILFSLEIIFRFFFLIKFIPFLNFKVKRILEKNNNIKFFYASGPSFYTHIIGFFLKKKFNMPLVIEYRDPWSFNPYVDKKFGKLFLKLDITIEKIILKDVDIITTVNPALNSFLISNFPFIKNKLLFSITHGLNYKISNNKAGKAHQKIIFVFAGTLYEKRSIVPLLNIISELNAENFFKNIKFILKVYGNYSKKKLEKIIKILNIEDLIYLGEFVPRSKIIQEIMKCDLPVHIGESLNYPTIAFKVWDYLSCGKKILYLGLKNSTTANFLEKEDLGIVLPLNNLSKSKLILKKLISGIQNNEFNNIVDKKKLIEYSWDNKAKQFINCIIKNFIIK